MPDDHSKLVPLLPIPNRTVKRLCADDSADPRVKVGHRQALIVRTPVCSRQLQTGVSSSARCSKEPTAAIGWLAVVERQWGEDGSTERGAR